MVRYTESNPASTPAWTSPYTYSASTATTTSSSANNNRSFESNYQIPNMNVYINKATCRQLNIVHHPHTETNIHPATLLSRIHLNEGQLFYLRAHSAAYPIVTTLLALPPEDWFECRIYPSPNGIPSMIMPPPPITAPVITADTHAPSGSTPTLNLSPIPIPTPLVHSCSLHSLLMSQSASPIDPSDTIWAKTSIPSPLPLMIDIDDDHWYLQDTDSPVTSIDTDSPVTLSSISPISSTPSSLPSSPSVNTFPSFLQPEAGSTTTTTTTLSQFPYPTVSSPTTINVQHVPLEMPQNQNSTPLTTRKRKSGGSPHTERSTPRKQEGHEEDEEQDSEVFTLSDIEERNSQPSSPAPLVLPTSAAEVFKRRKVLKKVYKKRYQQKSAIKRKIARFQATGDKAVVIFVTRNSQRKVGYDVEVYNPMKSSSDFLNPFWREQQSLVESYLRKHYAAKHTGEGETQQTQIHH